jgi:S-ribosylhomocysteine lyase LuxS involved in autoinducer biosynthesis
MGCRTGFYISVLSPVGGLSLDQMTETVAAVIPEAYDIEELPGATIETCGGYQEHDFEDAKVELKLLADAKLVPLHNPPFLS